jgi:regulator of protease activity HflC (stomatin/prohibitin superfamily)
MVFFKFIPSMGTGVVQTFGKYTRLVSPGLTFYLPFIQSIAIVSNKLTQN